MRTSISVPDNLWAEATGGRSVSASELVQDALRALVERERAGEDRLTGFTERLEGALVDGDDLGFDDTIERLVEDAREIRDTGYRMGLELAQNLRWVTLEALPASRRLTSELTAWAAGDDNSAPSLGSQLYQLLKDWEFGLDQEGEPIKSPVFFAAVAEALGDVRATILAKLRAEEGDL